MAVRISEFTDVSVISLYDSVKTSKEVVEYFSLNIQCFYCNGEENIILGLRKLKNLIVQGGYDIIHTHHTLSGSIARIAARKTKNSKVVHTVHAHHNSYSFVQNLIIGSTLKFSDVIVGNSRTTIDGLKKWQKYVSRNVLKRVIYNGVDSKKIIEAKNLSDTDDCKKIDLHEDMFVFGMVGRFMKVKNHKNVLTAFRNFLQEKQDYNKYKLILIGDGPEKNEIKNQINDSALLKESVILTGLIPKKCVYKFLHKIDVFIMASFYEGFCNALMEAMVIGVPAIISNIDIFLELFEEKKANTFNPNNPNEIKLCMLKAANEKKKSTDNYRNTELINKFDISISRDNYLKLYRYLIYGDNSFGE